MYFFSADKVQFFSFLTICFFCITHTYFFLYSGKKNCSFSYYFVLLRPKSRTGNKKPLDRAKSFFLQYDFDEQRENAAEILLKVCWRLFPFDSFV